MQRLAVDCGRGVVELDELPDTDEGWIASAERHFQSPSYRPPVAVELQAMAQHLEVEIPAVLALLSKDPFLAAAR